jgi:competence protein ComEC
VSPWTLPVVAGAFWIGLLSWPLVQRLAAPWEFLVAGLALLGLGAAIAPTRSRGPRALVAGGVLLEKPTLAAVEAPAAAGGRGPPLLVAVACLAGFLVLGCGWAGVHAGRIAASQLAPIAPAHVELEATLRSDPGESQYGWSAQADVSSVTWSGTASAAHESVWVSGDGSAPEAARADRVHLEGTLLVPQPGEFTDFLHQRGVAVELQAQDFVRVGYSSDPFVHGAQLFREFVGRSIKSLFPLKDAGLLMGLALGDTSALDAGLARDFQATGLGHLLVVSGENVAMVLAPILGLASWMGLRRWARIGLASGTVIFFILVTGAEPSVLRAGVMAGLALFATFAGRPRSSATILAGAVLILLVVDPSLVWAIGFQLSVAATAGMVLLASPLAERLRFLPKPAAMAAGTTLAAQIGVSPLLLFHFHEVPLVTILANLLAFPAVSPALLIGLSAGAVGVVVHPLGALISRLALVPLRYLETIADRLAKAPVAWITSGGGIGPLVVGALLIIFLTTWLPSGKRFPRKALVALVAFAPIFVWASALQAGPPSDLVIHFFDVGQGDSALVTSPSGVNILFDGGPDPEQVAGKLAALGVKRLDAVVATHPHADHILGLPGVMARFPVGVELDPGCPDDSAFSADLARAVHDEGIRSEHPRAGDTLMVGDLRLDVLSPESCWTGTNSDANNDSLVIKVTYREDSALMGAEPEEPAQQMLVDEDAPIEAEVLKVPHHGAATSIQGFFDAVHAQVAVVSVGPNDYGHPVPETLAEIRATGARVLRTDQEGDITITFAPEGLLVDSAA